jgi:ureidoglycolate lyase
MTTTLHAEPLTAERFAAFGTVIDTRTADHYPINAGLTERYHRLAVATADPSPDAPADCRGAETIISIFRGQPYPLPARLWMLERHPLGSQAFMPLEQRPWLVVVGPAGEPPSPTALRAFMARGDQGVNYAPGVWHHPLIALEAASDFLVVDRDGPGQNCDEAVPDTEIVVTTTELPEP